MSKQFAKFPTKKGRGESAMKVMNHKRVHELHSQFIKEAGDHARFLPKSFFVNKISDEMGYSISSVRQIMNEKPE